MATINVNVEIDMMEIDDDSLLDECKERGFPLPDGIKKDSSKSDIQRQVFINYLLDSDCPDAIREPILRWLESPSLYRLEVAMGVR